MNDTEREELEMAAKAAGITIDKSPDNGGGANNTGFDTSGNAVLDWHNGVTWNPRNDNGDALSLAVKVAGVSGFFQMQISSLGTLASNYTTTQDVWERGGIVKMDDPNAATRLAIVRAAAAIGRAMP